MLRRLPLANPVQRWQQDHVEYDPGETPEVGLEIYEDSSKSILSENDSPDLSFRYSINPYRGCAHGRDDPRHTRRSRHNRNRA